MNRKAIIVTLSALIATTGLLLAGPLNPPAGPVTSTYKTLNEVEPRVAVNATNTPGDATSVFKITQPGSYYLTGDPGLIPGGKHGILIAASNVTLDLNGFQIWSLGNITGALDGVSAAAGQAHITVLNGIVRNMNGDGIDLSPASECRVERVQALNNNGSGIALGARSAAVACNSRQNGVYGLAIPFEDSVLDGCISTQNTQEGFYIGRGCAASKCVASSNGGEGFHFTTSSVVSDCSSFLNGSHGYSSAGFATVARCSASENGGSGIYSSGTCTVIGCTASSNTLNGIDINTGTVADSTCESNKLDGIRCVTGCLIRGNDCHFNGFNGDGAGIHATNIRNRIEGNQCVGADRGMDVDATGNIIIRNTCTSNTVNWTIAAGNSFLIVQAPVNAAAFSGNAGGSGFGSTDPNANFTY